MSSLRDAAQAALEALELVTDLTNHDDEIYDAITALRAALAQEQAEPVQEQAEPLNLLDRAVQRRLAAQWGYVPAQAEPVQAPVAWVECDGELVWNNREAAIGRNLYTAPPRCPNCASLEAQNTELDRKLAEMEQAESAQKPIGYLWPTGRHPEFRFTQQKRDGVDGTPLYTAPPRRTMVPLTAQQLDGVIERHVGGSEITDDVYASMEQFARAIEKASWEKNK